MKIAILAHPKYGNSRKISDIISTLNYDDELYIDINEKSVAEKIAFEMCQNLNIKTVFVPRATAIADAVIIIYQDDMHELHTFKKEYYDTSFIDSAEPILI